MATITDVEVGRVVGTSVKRKEDLRLLTGRNRFVDDIELPGMVWMAVVRSPYAHARIGSVDLSAAREAPGIIAAWSGADMAEDWSGPLPMAWPVTEDINISSHWPLTMDKARYVGDGVAVVVAETREQAADAAALVQVDYEPLRAVIDVEQALADGAPLVHDEFDTNWCYTWPLAAGDVDGEFANAAVTVKERYRQQRLIPNAMEPRGVVAQPDPGTGELTLYTSTQIPHIARVTLTGTLGITESKLRVVAPDVGGGFGSKLDVYAEEALALALARRLARPVKWIETRSENYLATIHGRDVVQEIELAADEEGHVTAVRAKLVASMGGYLQLITPGIPLLGAWLYAGAYAARAYSFECTGAFTHTTPTDAYRGAGRPEATYAIERAMDALARKLAIDPVELRRRNFIKEFPYTIASGLTVDSGDYDAHLDRARELLDYESLRREQAERRAAGDTKLLGIGFSTYLEMCGLAPSRILGVLRYGAGGWDAASVRFLPTGTVELIIGTTPHGQSHVTTFSQIVAERLGLDVGDIEVLYGDTTIAPLGMDTYGSRSLPVGGTAVWNACQKVLDKARLIAAHQLNAPSDDLEEKGGTFTAPDGGTMTAKEAALAAWTAHDLPDGMEPGLEALAVFDPSNFSWPAGTHVAVVEIDSETGAVELRRYIAVDDVGRVINPEIVEGQVQGGIAQGVAQALWEEAVHDEDGNLMTSTMVDYLVPSAAELIEFEIDRTETPATTNPMGVKGVGETGTIASTAAVMNAVVDALSPLGITDVAMPATPERVWRAIQEVKR
jgi:carbon-monoxide dehydrogenase large subunit